MSGSSGRASSSAQSQDGQETNGHITVTEHCHREQLSYNQIAGQSVERLAALSDGVFAVAMTLLVLDLRPRSRACSQRAGSLARAGCACASPRHVPHELHDVGDFLGRPARRSSITSSAPVVASPGSTSRFSCKSRSSPSRRLYSPSTRNTGSLCWFTGSTFCCSG